MRLFCCLPGVPQGGEIQILIRHQCTRLFFVAVGFSARTCANYGYKRTRFDLPFPVEDRGKEMQN